MLVPRRCKGQQRLLTSLTRPYPQVCIRIRQRLDRSRPSKLGSMCDLPEVVSAAGMSMRLIVSALIVTWVTNLGPHSVGLMTVSQ